MSRTHVKALIRELLGQKDRVSAGEVAQLAGVTRQAAHRHLAQMVAAGELTLEGFGRGARYRRTVDLVRTYPLDGLQEDRVWTDVTAAVPTFSSPPNVRAILNHAFTEMLNNAIDHSRGAEARVTATAGADLHWFEVADDGVGVFANLRERFALPDDASAIQELSKGKQTTDPIHHSGQGIFFTSKLVDIFELESGGTIWIVDNLRDDQAIGSVPTAPGTRVRCWLDPSTSRTPKEVFDRYSDETTYEFDKTSIAVKLFQPGGSFVSRSEAKRLAARLEDFKEARINFQDVEAVGQAFADELFRVWARSHPGTRLVPINMNPNVRGMISRATLAPT